VKPALQGELLGQGGSAEVYAWGETLVVKLFRPQYAYAAELEARRARLVHAAGVRAPAVSELVFVDGRPGILYERVPGPLLWQRIREQEEAAPAVGQLLAELHLELHQYQVPELEPWTALRVSAEQRLPESERALFRTQAERVPPGGALCHGDFHPGNVIMGRSPVIIDWVNACSAHPALDVARSFMVMRYHGLRPPRPESTGRSVRIRRALTDAYLQHYLAIGDVTREQVVACQPLCASAMLRSEPENVARSELEQIATSGVTAS